MIRSIGDLEMESTLVEQGLLQKLFSGTWQEKNDLSDNTMQGGEGGMLSLRIKDTNISKSMLALMKSLWRV